VVRIAVVGKGGAGKSVIAGTMARVLARRGHRVLALDSDLMPGLALSLGAQEPSEPPLNAAAERDADGRWRLRRGIGPVRAVQRYSTPAPDGVSLLQVGKPPAAGLEPVMGAMNAFYRVIHRIAREKALRDWTIVGDLPAGPRQLAFDWAPYADTLLVVAEPKVQSLLTARRISGIATARGGIRSLALANRVDRPADSTRVGDALGLPVVGALPADPAVAEAERLGTAAIDHAPSASFVRGVEELVERLERGTLAR
jgi:CO dehydrogenase maturation factor